VGFIAAMQLVALSIALIGWRTPKASVEPALEH